MKTRSTPFRKWYLIYLLIPLLLWWALKDAPFTAIWNILQGFSAGEIVILFLLNFLILVILAFRWWVLLRVIGQRVPFRFILLYRLAGIGISYFTPGPQIGGEALQVWLLKKRSRVATSQALLSVSLDKVAETLAKYGFLAMGLMVVFYLGLFKWQPPLWSMAAGLLVVSLV
ncbi:MAG: flippase-like domain-containing protein, partial [Calditrichia bacterium]